MDKELQQNRNRTKSLRVIIKQGMAAIVILLFCFCIFSLSSVWKHLTSYTILVYKDMLQLQVQEIENDFKKMQEDLAEVAVFDENVMALRKLPGSAEYDFHKLQINRKLREDMERYQYVDGAYILDLSNSYVISQYGTTTTYDEMQQIKIYLQNHLTTEWNRNSIVCIDGEWYYFYALSTDGVIIGSWSRLDRLFRFEENQTTSFVGERFELGEKTYQNGELSSKLQVSVTGDVTKMTYTTFLSKADTYAAVIHLMWGNILVCVGVFAVVLAVLLWIVKKVLQPISYMENELRIVASNPNHRISHQGEVTEFRLLYDSLNQMLEQVCHLQIQIYEEQMEKQKIYNSYLVLQMNPHFYVNSLNVIHSLAQIKNYNLIEKMTAYLSGYLNYMFRKGGTVATIGEELKHIDNFLAIQQIRYAEACSFSVEVREPQLYEAKIPLLLFHTFVENSIKYSQNQIRRLEIRIEISRKDNEKGVSLVFVRIEDNGQGFSTETLKQINRHDAVCREDGEHIGIKNLWERGTQYYGTLFSMNCCNRQGACVELQFPVELEADYWKEARKS